MPSLVDRAKSRLLDVRRRRPLVDHAVRMQEHYSETRAVQQAGAVTYFGFLSVFPILALSVFVVGWVSRVYPDADQTLRDAIESILPGLVGPGENEVSLDDIRTFSGWAAVVGLAGVLYAGLGWVTALRRALAVVFEIPERGRRSFVVGKVIDLLALVVVGVVLMVAVALTGLVSGFSEDLLGWLGLDAELGWLVVLLTVAFGLAANALMFFCMFKLLGNPHVPTRALWSGALLGALGFEVLKQVSGLLLSTTKEQPAFQAFGIALILLVWINYFSRVVLYAASWAWTAPDARSQRVVDPADRVQGPQTPSLDDLGPDDAARPTRAAAFGAGLLAGAGLHRLTTRRKDRP